jgi:hypothetical protein
VGFLHLVERLDIAQEGGQFVSANAMKTELQYVDSIV